jgi:phage-related baseplate assembly protein
MTIDLSRLPAPNVVESLDFEAIFAAMLAELQTRDPGFAALVESEPAYKILQVCAYRELLLRQRVNEAARAVMLAYATGPDLDQIGGNYGVPRLLIAAGNPDAIPPTPDTFEADGDFRYRIQLSMAAYSVAGPQDAYLFHALSADGRVRHVTAQSPSPGNVVVSVLARDGDGTPSAEVLQAVEDRLTDKTVRPLTDAVTVRAATIVPFDVTATLFFYSGPDPAIVLAAAQAALDAYLAAVKKIGHDITRSGLFAALHQPGVQRVHLTSPAADITIDALSAGHCVAITLTDGGTDE